MISREHLDGLTRLANFIDEMNQTTSNRDKLQKLTDHSGDTFIVRAMEYTYSPYKKFGVHRDTAEKHSDLAASLYADLFGMLDDLAERKITGHHAITAVNGFAGYLNPDQREVLFRILDGDLKMRASTSMINKTIPGCIPTFSVALAQAYDPKYVDFDSETWLASRKLDGVRCICRKEGGQITFYSRNGHEFYTLDRVAQEVAKIPGNFVMDGEICLVDDDGVEDFQGIMKEIKRKDHTMQRPMYLLFDMLTLEEFDSEGEKAELSLVKRLAKINEALSTNQLDPNVVKYVSQIPVKEDTFQEMVDAATALSWEGIMIRKNVPYQGKRTRDLLKVKKFYDAEYVVKEAFMGPIRWVEDGKEVEKECLSYVTIEHKGHEVRVGSGFSKEQRELYYERPEEIIGKTVTVKYFEETSNQNGGLSLRFPTIKHIYDGKRTT
jgi:DNA ligase-1